MRKRKIILLAIGLIIIIAVASTVTLIYFSQKSAVYYNLIHFAYHKTGGNWYTETTYYIGGVDYQLINGTFLRIECGNLGLLDASFSIIVQLTNATFHNDSTPASQFVNAITVKLSYNLHSQETSATDVNFTINNNIAGFAIATHFQTSQDGLGLHPGFSDQQHNLPYDYYNGTLVPELVS